MGCLFKPPNPGNSKPDLLHLELTCNLSKTQSFDRLCTGYRCTVILGGCKPLKKRTIRNRHVSNPDVENAMECFFNRLPEVP